MDVIEFMKETETVLIPLETFNRLCSTARAFESAKTEIMRRMLSYSAECGAYRGLSEASRILFGKSQEMDDETYN